MKPFDYEAAKAGAPICTRDGRKARIIYWEAKSRYPIIALVETYHGEEPKSYALNGKYEIGAIETDADLFMTPVKREGWINIYLDKYGNRKTSCVIWPTEAEARGHRDRFCIDTIKAEWEDYE